MSAAAVVIKSGTVSGTTALCDALHAREGGGVFLLGDARFTAYGTGFAALIGGKASLLGWARGTMSHTSAFGPVSAPCTTDAKVHSWAGGGAAPAWPRAAGAGTGHLLGQSVSSSSLAGLSVSLSAGTCLAFLA